MPEYSDLLEDDDFDESSLVKKLRAALKDQSAKIKELSEENGTLKGATRTRSIEEILKESGYKPALATFIPADVEATKDAVDAWLGTYGELFSGARAAAASAVEDSNAAPAQRMAALEETAGLDQEVTVPADIEQRINAAQSMEELQAVLRSIG